MSDCSTVANMPWTASTPKCTCAIPVVSTPPRPRMAVDRGIWLLASVSSVVRNTTIADSPADASEVTRIATLKMTSFGWAVGADPLRLNDDDATRPPWVAFVTTANVPANNGSPPAAPGIPCSICNPTPTSKYSWNVSIVLLNRDMTFMLNVSPGLRSRLGNSKDNKFATALKSPGDTTMSTEPACRRVNGQVDSNPQNTPAVRFPCVEANTDVGSVTVSWHS
mmetsp:Transcript_13832/g.35559  ORF Transcript_13832/g.35559 Transcript_13832/m.35559 type:complete len:223 (+) Transcript_13832:5278-5946(+)